MTLLSKSLLPGLCVLVLGTLMLIGGDAERAAAVRAAADDVDRPKPTEKPSPPKPEPAKAESAAESPASPPARPPSLVEKTREARQVIRRAMQKKIKTEFVDTPLFDAVEYLAEEGGFPVYINETALGEEGIANDEPVTDTLVDVTIEQALNWILRPLGLTWIIEDEVLKVTTEIDAEEKLYTRVYDVKKLLTLAVSLAANEPTGSCAQPSFAEGASGCNPPKDYWYNGWLIELILSVTSGPWFVFDGTGGTMTGINDVLTVRQTQKLHEEVAQLLKALEAVADGKARQSSIAVRPSTYPHKQDAAIEAALLEKGSVNYLDNSLSSVVADVAARHKIRVRLNEIALAEEGIASDEPITLKLKDITLGSILHLLLEPLGLTSYVSEGALWITTEIDAEELLHSVVYDVRDLAEPYGEYQSLNDLIQQETSGPWWDIDGTGGPVSEVEAVGALVIRQTDRVHKEIAQLLADLRKTIARQPKSEKPKSDPDAVETRVYNLAGMQIVDDLLTALPRFVAPKTWGDDHEAGAIQKVGETLVIRHSLKVHRQIERFLEKFAYYQQSGYRGGAGFWSCD